MRLSLRCPKAVLVSVLFPFALAGQAQTSRLQPDAIYFDGYIITGEHLTDLPEHVEAMAVRNGSVEAIGSNATVLDLKGPGTQLVDLGGAFVMPGFNDAHAHLAAAGLQKLSVDLTGVQSLAEMKSRIQAAAAKKPAGEWLVGGGWDQTRWADRKLPTRQDIDSVTGDHPAFFERTDGHIGIASTAALRTAGITSSTPDPRGGKLDHVSSTPGSPLTGIVRDTAMPLVESHEPAPNAAARSKALSLALADAATHGVTSVQDYSSWPDFLAFQSLQQHGKLTARISEWLTFNDPIHTLDQQRAMHLSDPRMLRTGMLKGFMDGSLGSRTAALNAPYADDPKNSGLPRYTQQNLNDMTVARMGDGFQVGFHAIGDHAVEMALNAFAKAEAAHPEAKALRPRIEHSQVLAAADFERYHQLGVIASMQPNHLLTDMQWAESRLGHDRARYSYAWKSFLDHHVPLAFGTDYPVEPITPFRGLYAAVTRRAEVNPKGAYFPEERLNIGQAIYAYTQGSAYAEFAEKYKGQLLPGYVADFVVLDRNLLALDPPELLNVQVLRTVVGGHTVFQQTARR